MRFTDEGTIRFVYRNEDDVSKYIVFGLNIEHTKECVVKYNLGRNKTFELHIININFIADTLSLVAGNG